MDEHVEETLFAYFILLACVIRSVLFAFEAPELNVISYFACLSIDHFNTLLFLFLNSSNTLAHAVATEGLGDLSAG